MSILFGIETGLMAIWPEINTGGGGKCAGNVRVMCGSCAGNAF